MTLETEWQSWYRGGKSEWQNNQFFSSSENEPSLLYIHLGATNKKKYNETKGYHLQKVHFLDKRTFAIFMWNKCSRVILYHRYFAIASCRMKKRFWAQLFLIPTVFHERWVLRTSRNSCMHWEVLQPWSFLLISSSLHPHNISPRI